MYGMRVVVDRVLGAFRRRGRGGVKSGMGCWWGEDRGGGKEKGGEEEDSFAADCYFGI